MQNIINQRRSIRKYTDYKISDQEILDMIDEAAKAPSSQNLQPWRFLVVGSNEAKETLRTIMPYNQNQLETSSHMIIVMVDTHKTERASDIFTKAVALGLMPETVKEDQLKKIAMQTIDPNNPKYQNSLFLDAGLFAMSFMLIAKTHGYDTCSIGGFNKDGFNSAFNIEERYMPALIISVGKADEEGFSSVRLDAKDITTII